eukprot:CAMPEP_0117046324 /NCGR_PEP_ID=MMETSP0472-20121206/32031_1 /TAXON_ID=693140 ORGANISM="Tiarina fusus, Strain LIS" /NCGR_SAMPLE_ID=MMETSP0472 /ASSEMBLY_ACC=CAM_ASM_000603 /LENGTH=60 /DNA_ID=CAMNT_0004758633 /DNA_START=149 /DNA_END=331 /DNA_ORIENTATION=-
MFALLAAAKGKESGTFHDGYVAGFTKGLEKGGFKLLGHAKDGVLPKMDLGGGGSTLRALS